MARSADPPRAGRGNLPFKGGSTYGPREGEGREQRTTGWLSWQLRMVVVKLSALHLALATEEVRSRRTRHLHVKLLLLLRVGVLADDLADDVAAMCLSGFRRSCVRFMPEVTGRFPDAGGDQVLPVGDGAVRCKLQVALEGFLLQAKIERAANRAALFQQVLRDLEAFLRPDANLVMKAISLPRQFAHQGRQFSVGDFKAINFDPSCQRPQFWQVGQGAVADEDQAAAERKSLRAIGSSGPGDETVVARLRQRAERRTPWASGSFVNRSMSSST